MYSHIIDPLTQKAYKLQSNKGISILQNYINQAGGKYIGKGTYKFVFSPPIRCAGEDKRYNNTNKDNYISAITTYGESLTEIKNEKIRNKFDPKEEFTLKLLKSCKIGQLDSKTEKKKEFSNCADPITGNFLSQYEYPYNQFDFHSPDDLRLIINRNGGVNLKVLLKNLSKLSNKDLVKLLPILFIKFKFIFKGLIKMGKAGYAHCDIKSGNILYNINKKKFYLIDFGLMSSFKKLFKKSYFIDYTINVPYNGYYYYYWPIDVGVSATFLKRLKKSKDLNFSPPISEGPSRYNIYRNPKNIKELYYNNIDNPKVFIKNSKEKLDTYSLGITMKEFFLSNKIERLIKKLLKIYKTNNSLINIKKMIPRLSELINEMTEINPIKRISIVKASQKYNNLIDIL